MRKHIYDNVSYVYYNMVRGYHLNLALIISSAYYQYQTENNLLPPHNPGDLLTLLPPVKPTNTLQISNIPENYLPTAHQHWKIYQETT